MAKVEVDEVLGFFTGVSMCPDESFQVGVNRPTVGHETTEVPSDDAMPRSTFAAVELDLC